MIGAPWFRRRRGRAISEGQQDVSGGRTRTVGLPPAFRYPKYRVYWAGFFLAVAGHQVFQFVQFVLVYEIAESVAQLGYVSAANAVPSIVLGVVGGVYADRWEKRRLIIVTQIASGLILLALAALTMAQAVQVWHVMAVAFLIAAIGAFDGPARSAYYPRLIAPPAMISAVALNSTVWQATRIVGPAVAGVIVGVFADVPLTGIAIALFIAAFGYAAMVAAMLWINVAGVGASRGRAARDLLDGLAYLRVNRTVLTLILMAFAFGLFGWSYVVLMPVFAEEYLGVGKEGQGALLAASGAGATVVTVTLAVVDSPVLLRRGVFVIGGAVSSGVLLVAFALVSGYMKSYPMALALMFGLGMTQMVYTTGTMGSIQLSITDAMRGRVLGVYGILWGIQPLSGTQAAFIAQFVGVPIAVAIGGGMIVAMALFALAFSPELRSLRIHETVQDEKTH